MLFDKIFAIDYWHVSVRQPPRGEEERIQTDMKAGMDLQQKRIFPKVTCKNSLISAEFTSH